MVSRAEVPEGPCRTTSTVGATSRLTQSETAESVYPAASGAGGRRSIRISAIRSGSPSTPRRFSTASMSSCPGFLIAEPSETSEPSRRPRLPAARSRGRRDSRGSTSWGRVAGGGSANRRPPYCVPSPPQPLPSPAYLDRVCQRPFSLLFAHLPDNMICGQSLTGEASSPMAEHVLLTYATRRPYRDAPDMPDGAEYDYARGYWTKDGSPLVLATEFADDRGSPTKKCDQETGEDQKGE